MLKITRGHIKLGSVVLIPIACMVALFYFSHDYTPGQLRHNYMDSIESKEPIKLAVYWYKNNYLNYAKGIRMAVDEVNEKGGVKGHPVEIVWYPQRGSFTADKGMFYYLQDDLSIGFILGFPANINTDYYGLTKLTRYYGVPAMLEIASLKTEQNNWIYETTFQGSSTIHQLGHALSRIAFSNRALTILLCYPPNSLGADIINIIIKNVDLSPNVTLVPYEVSSLNDQVIFNISEELKIAADVKIKDEGVLLHKDGTIGIVSLLATADDNIRLLRSIQRIERLQFALIGSMFEEQKKLSTYLASLPVNSFYLFRSNKPINLKTRGKQNDPALVKFMNAYTKKFKEKPGKRALEGYGQTVAVLHAFSKSPTFTPIDVSDTLLRERKDSRTLDPALRTFYELRFPLFNLRSFPDKTVAQEYMDNIIFDR